MKKIALILITFVFLAVQSSFAAGVTPGTGGGSTSGGSQGSTGTGHHQHHQHNQHHPKHHHRK